MKTIYLDISNRGIIPRIEAKQNDIGRKFVVVITDNGVPYEVQSNSIVSIWYEGASGEGNYTDVGDKPAVSVEKNKITIELIEQMLAVAGNGVLTILINSANGEQIGLWNIDYSVEKTAGVESEKAEDYYTAFSQSAASLAQSAETIGKAQNRIDSIIKAKNATAAGLIYPLASSSVPSGFLLCDGAEYSRTEYAELFDAIGTVYGEGDGTTTFNVPNLSTRVPVGSGEDYNLGDTGGEATHNLTVGEMPQHSHSIRSLRFSKEILATEQEEHRSIPLVNDWWYEDGDTPLPYDLGKIEVNGGSEAHNIMQPYIVVNYIISTGKEVEFIIGGTGSGGGTAEGAVLYTAQELTPEQQAQARENMGAAEDAELVDICVGADGVTYANAGDAVRTQLGKLFSQSDIVHLKLVQGSYSISDGAVGLNQTTKRLSTPEGEFCIFPRNITLSVSEGYHYIVYQYDAETLTLVKWYDWITEPAEFPSGYAYKFMLAKVATPTEKYPEIVESEAGNILCVVEPTSKDREELQDIRLGADGFTHASAGDAVRSIGRNLHNAETRLGAIDGMAAIHESDFKIGDINISTSGWKHNADYKYRVSTRDGVTFPLKVGDTIKLTDYTDARFYIGWLDASGTYGCAEWNTADYVVQVDGEYVINIANRTEKIQTNVSDLLGLLRIVYADCLLQKVEQTREFAQRRSFIESIGHRGYGYAPNNTLPAFKEAKRHGFDAIECDLSFTGDNVAVLLHDTTINSRARNADGTQLTDTVYIADITYEQALEYDFGIYKGAKYAGTKIPTFAETLRLCKQLGLKVYAELKNGFTTERIQQVINIAKRAGMLDKVVWITFSKSWRSIIKDVDETAAIGVLCSSITSDVITDATSLRTGNNIVIVDSSSYTDEEIELCVAADLPLYVYEIDDVETILNLDEYISGVTSNYINASFVSCDGQLDQ